MKTTRVRLRLLCTMFMAVLLAASGMAREARAQDKPSGEVQLYMNIDKAREKWMNEIIIPNFQKDNPGITIKLVLVPWADFDTKLVTLTAAGTPPDLFAQWGQAGIGTYNARGLVRPIDDLIQKWDWDLSGIDPKFRDFYKVDGQTMGIPMYSLGVHMFYNKDLFDKAGVPYPPTDWSDSTWTWDEMISRAQKLTVANDDPSQAQWGLVYLVSDLYGGAMWEFGADFFDPAAYKTGKLSKVTLTSKEAMDALQARADAILKFKVMPKPEVVKAMRDAGEPLATGRVGMVMGGDWEMWSLQDLKDLHWGIAALPRGYKDKPVKSATFSDPFFIHKNAKNPDAAFTFVKWLTTGPGAKYIVSGLQSPTVVTAELPNFYKLFPSIPAKQMEQAYLGAVQFGQENAASLINGYDQIDNIYQQRMAPVWTGDKKLADVLPGLEQEMNDAIKNIQ